jgi:superfamily II DNA/RNA helicase
MGREDRRKAQERFLHHRDVQVLLATDAAGEGINLQRAHLIATLERLEGLATEVRRSGQDTKWREETPDD